MAQSLAKYGVFAGMLSFAGLPIYLHAPKYFVDTYGVSLTAIGLVLLGLRVLDFIQDPLIGMGLDIMRTGHGMLSIVAGILLSASMVAMFAVTAIGDPLIWFAATMVVLFSSFSILSIMFYAQGVATAASLQGQGHVRLAIWRETGGLVGVSFAAVAPTVFSALGVMSPMTGFAISFACIVFVATFMMASEWRQIELPKPNTRAIFGDPMLRRLLIVALLNAAPVAVTASLFLFFVEYRLGSQTAAGPLLLLFFVSAALSVPMWGRLAEAITVRLTLLGAMALSISTFACALLLQTGDILPFALICAASGATLGADMTLLPAAFARRIDQIGISGSQAFGLWSFCAKFTLALAAAFVLPTLEWAGFSTTSANSETTLWALTLLYAGLPCLLKLGAMTILFRTHLQEV